MVRQLKDYQKASSDMKKEVIKNKKKDINPSQAMNSQEPVPKPKRKSRKHKAQNTQVNQSLLKGETIIEDFEVENEALKTTFNNIEEPVNLRRMNLTTLRTDHHI